MAYSTGIEVKMKLFYYGVFRQCFNSRSQDTGLFLPESVRSGADSYYIYYQPAGSQLFIMQLSVQGYGPDQHFVIRKQSASRLCSLPESISC